ncbi:MAG: hypothetical protein WBE18_01535, partial [Gammaproteobacteria bacterium]
MVFAKDECEAEVAINKASEIITNEGNDNLQEKGYKDLSKFCRIIAKKGTTDQKKAYFTLIWNTREKQTREECKNLYSHVAYYFLQCSDKC